MPFLSFICSGADEELSLVTSNENKEGEESDKTQLIALAFHKTRLIWSTSVVGF